jgi:hypothetical protein
MPRQELHMTSLRRPVALLAGGALALAVSGPALAGTPDSWPRFYDTTAGEVQPVDGVVTVCEWWMEFQPLPGGEWGSWELWQGDTKIDDDPYEVGEPGSAADREPTFTNFTLPEGRYLLIWDDEAPVDSSRQELTVVVDCPDAPTPAPTDTPAPTGTVAPTDTPAPTGTVAPTESAPPADTPTPTPSGTVLAETGTPAFTLPPTDVVTATETTQRGLPLVLLLIGLLTTAVALAARGFALRR